MSKKILVFLSVPNGKGINLYFTPDGGTVEGEMTNDAPLRYLLSKHPDTQELLCITTQKSEGTFERLEALLRQNGCTAVCRKIPYDESKSFETTVLPAVSASLQAGDELLLDITGGKRNIVLYLTLLCRIFTYQGIRIAEAVYSDLSPCRVLDATPLLKMFDLIGGMQELTSFGSVRTLRTYYGQPSQDPAVDELLCSVENLKECIDLCRTRKLTEGMERFKQALEQAAKSDDPLLQVLLPAFRDKFDGKVDILSLIRWCVESEMLQQALTIYNEMVPALIYGENKLIYPTWAIPIPVKSYTSNEIEQLVGGVLKMSEKHSELQKNRNRNRIPYTGQQLIRTLKLDSNRRSILDQFAAGRAEGREDPQIPDYIFENLAMVCMLAYGWSGKGPYCSEWVKKLPKNRGYLKPLKEWMEEEKLETAEMFLTALCNSPRKLQEKLLQQPQWDFISYGSKKGGFTRSIEQLDTLMNLFGYAANIPVKQLKPILRDYVYIRTLRNMANHANDASTSDQKKTIADLSQHGYPDPEKIGSREAGKQLLDIINRLKRELDNKGEGLH